MCKVTLADISEKALGIAQKNAQENGVAEKIEILQTDLWEKVKGTYHVIVSNPPYIPTATIKTLSLEAQKEPKLALDGGEDGLSFYRELFRKADQYLVSGGWLLCEIGYDQAEAVKAIWQEQKEEIGLVWEGIEKDLAGLDRVIKLRRK